MEESYFKDTLNLLAEEKQFVIDQISAIIAVYWSWFKLENKRILEKRKAGLSSTAQSTIAPVLEKRNRNNNGDSMDVPAIVKHYVLWKQFDNSAYRSINPHASTYIKVAKPENIIKVVGKKCTWDYEQFVETEKKLAPLRQILDAIHRTEITVISEQRKYLRRFNQKNHAIE